MACLLFCAASSGQGSPQPQFTAEVRSGDTFPDPRHATRKEGVFISPDTVRLITPGMTKRQIYALLGVPHFHEGLFGERTWNFILNFYTGRGTEYIICQYQIHFDHDRRVDFAAWNSDPCQQVVASAEVETSEVPATVQRPSRAPRQLTLFFGFGSSSLTPDSMAMIEDLVKSSDGHEGTIHIIGHTDRAGSDAYNDALSLARATAVANMLMAQGIPRERLNISALGERSPVIQTPDGVKESRNRRTELIIFF